jgi:hypothetical protein
VTTPQGRLFSPGRRRRGRIERRVDDLCGWLRGLEEFDAHRRAVAGVALSLAAALDRLEADPDRSEHTVATVARPLLEALDRLRPEEERGDDDLEGLADLVQSALRDTPDT